MNLDRFWSLLVIIAVIAFGTFAIANKNTAGVIAALGNAYTNAVKAATQQKTS